MAVNSDKPQLWKKDIAASVDLYNAWFLDFAPTTYRETRRETVELVERALSLTKDNASIDPAMLRAHPGVLPTLRMSCCPPIARDRLSGLSYVGKPLIGTMEDGKLPPRMASSELEENLKRIADVFSRLLDRDIFPWLQESRAATSEERYRASTIVADRLCGAMSDPIIRNAQEKRQLAIIRRYLEEHGYRHKQHPPSSPVSTMEPGTFSFRTNVEVGDALKVNIPIDVAIQPRTLSNSKVPILIEAKSAGDFTNVNKRRKEEAAKIHQLRQRYGGDTRFILFLCGYFDGGYLGYEATEGIDWIWEHRIADFAQLGL